MSRTRHTCLMATYNEWMNAKIDQAPTACLMKNSQWTEKHSAPPQASSCFLLPGRFRGWNNAPFQSIG